jgi:DNA primase
VIAPEFIQQVLSRVDIVEVIDRQVKLKKAGQGYVACCPFHNEKSPSFNVSPSKQFYHCFGCGVSGSAITFLIEYNGTPFLDALRELAEQVGMVMPTGINNEEVVARAKLTASLTDVMLSANQFYRRELKRSPVAIEYFKKRGVSGEIALRFQLGYAPDDWQGLKAAYEDYSMASLAECGLVIDNEEGRRYDRFRDRVMFPILDTKGNTIGFGGRVIGAGEPKYLNSPETPLFEKGRELYGLFQARRAIRDSATVIVVEGYMDVVALAQNGVGNAVATLGTATTPMHLEKLSRMADTIVFCFDGDKAGRRAAWRALEISLPTVVDGKNYRFLFLPEEDDPDTYVRRLGKAGFDEALAAAKPLSTVLFEELTAQVNMEEEEGRAKLLNIATPLIAQITAPALGLMLRKRLAELMGMQNHELANLLPALQQPRYANTGQQNGNPGFGNQQKGSGNFKSNSAFNSPNKGQKKWGKKEAERGAPTLRREPMPGTSFQILAALLMKPQLAQRFDIDADADANTPLGTLVRVVHFIRDHDCEMHVAALVESFRETPDFDDISKAVNDKRYRGIESERLDIDGDFDGAMTSLKESIALKTQRAEEFERAKKMGLV